MRGAGGARVSDRVTLRRLSGTPEDRAALLRVMCASPAFYRTVCAREADERDVDELFAVAPPGVAAADKHVLAVEERGVVVGCADLVRGWPAPEVAFIGLLVLEEGVRGRGLGRAAYAALEERARSWGATRLRLGVLEVNARGQAFWSRLGFEVAGEPAPWREGGVETRVFAMERALGDRAGA